VVARDEDGREEEKGEERDQNERRADKVCLRLRGLFGDVVKLGCSARRRHRSTTGSPAAQHSRDQSNVDACVGKYGRTEFIIFEGAPAIGGGSAAAILSRLAFTVSICATGLGVKGRFCYVGEGACSRNAPRSWFSLGTGHEDTNLLARQPTSDHVAIDRQLLRERFFTVFLLLWRWGYNKQLIRVSSRFLVLS
jgi:hypothetical protein